MLTCAVLAGLLSLAPADQTIPVYSVIDKDFFPYYWRTAEIAPTATKISSAEFPRSLAAIERASAKYSPALLQANLKGIYVCRKLNFYGLPYGGTNSDSAIYLSNDGVENGFTDQYLEGAFHHELSSILLRNYASQFPLSKWTACLPLSFSYRGDGVQSVREGTASTLMDSHLACQGFLTQYSTSSMEEDFNMIVESVMVGNPDFWKACDRYPALRRKADLVVEFYNRIDPKLTVQRIKSFASSP